MLSLIKYFLHSTAELRMASYYEAARQMEAIDWQKRVTYYLKTCFIFNYQLMKVCL